MGVNDGRRGGLTDDGGAGRGGQYAGIKLPNILRHAHDAVRVVS